MINELPYYEMPCNCGITIRGNNENGLVSLVKKHIESGKFHTAWLHNGGTEDIHLAKLIDEAHVMKRGL